VESLNSVAPREPRHDEFASARAGYDLEDLSRISPAQPYRSNGPVLRTSTVRFFESIADTGKAGRFETGRSRDEIAELAAAGYATANGRLTESGAAFATPWREYAFGLSLAARREGLQTGMQVWVGGGLALLATGPAPLAADRTDVGPDRLQLDLVSVAQLPMAIASWCGLGPAWTLHGNVTSCEAERFYARLGSSTEPAPAGSDDATKRMWAEPWLAWNIRKSGPGAGHSWLNAGAAGHYRVGNGSDGSITLLPEPSAAVWDSLVRFIHAAVELPQPHGLAGP
jgi:hypothetical protein